MNIRELIEFALKESARDGLYNNWANCSCESGDIAPCGNINLDECRTGYKTKCDCDEKHAFHIGKN